jgi:Ca2+-binding RTX toxin-like protein
VLYAEVKYKGTRADPWIRPECSNYEATMDGGSGNDLIEGSPGDDRLIGGPGNDGITGMNGDDRLIGGPGSDNVDGKKGRDVCQGERVRDCEKRI